MIPDCSSNCRSNAILSHDENRDESFRCPFRAILVAVRMPQGGTRCASLPWAGWYPSPLQGETHKQRNWKTGAAGQRAGLTGRLWKIPHRQRVHRHGNIQLVGLEHHVLAVVHRPRRREVVRPADSHVVPRADARHNLAQRQLHPTTQALSTIHIPLIRRYIRRLTASAYTVEYTLLRWSCQTSETASSSHSVT